MRPAIDAMWTILPQRRATMPGTNACAQRNGPVAFTAKSRFHSSSPTRASGAELAMPALDTRMSTVPKRAPAAACRRAIESASETSQGTASALAPVWRISSATASISSALRAATITRAPASASSRAVAAPMPRPPPVTSATLPSRSICIVRRAPPVTF